jgi:DNA-binding PadR family transcriptional regulator
MSLLLGLKEADFNYLKKNTGATSGNISVQIDKLQQAGYIEVRKTFKGKMPQTICKISAKGVKAFEEYVNTIKSYLEPGE